HRLAPASPRHIGRADQVSHLEFPQRSESHRYQHQPEDAEDHHRLDEPYREAANEGLGELRDIRTDERSDCPIETGNDAGAKREPAEGSKGRREGRPPARRERRDRGKARDIAGGEGAGQAGDEGEANRHQDPGDGRRRDVVTEDGRRPVFAEGLIDEAWRPNDGESEPERDASDQEPDDPRKVMRYRSCRIGWGSERGTHRAAMFEGATFQFDCTPTLTLPRERGR